jgi:oxygen-independent coproporphyrinogen-3 oxidase
VENRELTDDLITDRKCQRLIKNAMYRAALRAGRKKPVWGALTGVRPGKLLAGFLREGLSEEEAARRFYAHSNQM